VKHTQAKRGSDGRFGGTDGPKAKRVEVWLQPQTVELLDTLCKQWSVGRGKVIDQLLTRGPVPPAAWEAVEVEATPSPEPTPTPSAPKPKPTKRQKLQQQADHINQQPIPDAKFADGDRVVDNRGRSFAVLSAQWHKAGVSASRDVVLNAHWQYRCKPEKGSESYLPEDLLKPEPTTSDRVESAVDALRQFEEKHRAEWQLMADEAKRLQIKPDVFQRFQSELKIPRTYPISREAEQAIREAIEKQQRSTTGEALAIQRRIEAIRKCILTNSGPGELVLLTDHLSNDLSAVDERVAKQYLFNALPMVGLPRYRRLTSTIWTKLSDCIGGDDEDFRDLLVKEDKFVAEHPVKRCLFWGALLRSPNIEDASPSIDHTDDGQEFLNWIQYNVTAQYRQRRGDSQFEDALGVLGGQRISDDRARKLLNLPEQGVDLTRKAINDAFKSLARKHHPDVGGDPVKFQGINEARERLLKTVNN